MDETQNTSCSFLPLARNTRLSIIYVDLNSIKSVHVLLSYFKKQILQKAFNCLLNEARRPPAEPFFAEPIILLNIIIDDCTNH